MLLFDSSKVKNITAVVGPNGSGKSNVADAIRWVTGEQSSKNLRSKKGEDVIFCGSAAKPRGSYAEVTIVLADEKSVKFEINNKEYELTEIEVARKLYRSGESEYLINRKKVRLADIQQLLASLGFGQSSYTVIGQGMVDKLLFFTAAERKVLFDEAAGVKQYEIKREQAIRKLESTDANLIRLKDILTELNPRVANLRRLVKRAEGRKDVEAELFNNRIKYYGSLNLEYSNELKEVEAQRKTLNVKIVQIEERLASLDAKVSENRKNPFREERETIERSLARLNSERDSLKEMVAYLKGQIESVLKSREQLIYRRDHLAKESLQATDKVKEIKDSIGIAESQALESRSSLDAEIKKLGKIEKDINDLDKQLSNPTQTSSTDNISKIENDLTKLSEQRQELTGQIYATRQKISTAQALAEQKKRDWQKLEDAIASLSEQILSIETQINDLNLNKKSLENSIKTTEKHLAAAVAKLNTSEKELRDLAGEISDSNLIELTSEISMITKGYSQISSKISLAKTLGDLSRIKDEFADYGNNLDKMFSRVASVVKAVNPKEREKLEKNIAEFRGYHETLTGELQERSYELVRVSSEINSLEQRLRDLVGAKKSRKVELTDIGQTVSDNDGKDDVAKLEKELARVVPEIALLENELKKYSSEVSERQNAILREKDSLQTTYREQRQRVYNLETEVSRKENDLFGLKTDLEKLLVRKTDIEKELNDLENLKSSDDSSIETELVGAQKKLSNIEGDIAKERGGLIQISEKEREHREKGSSIEREIRGLGDEKVRLQGELSTLEIASARVGVRLEDLTKEMDLEGFVVPEGKYEILDQMEKDVLRLKIENIRRKLDNTASVDPETEAEYIELEKRSSEMESQVDDLSKAKDDLAKVVKELDERIKTQFSSIFKDIANEFNRYFIMLFNGGNAKLSLGEDEEGSFGIEISANPPGKRVQSLAALSGGERTLTSLALLFAILSVNPSPFVVLDEVDAALDESNTARFIKIIEDLAKKTQFIVISHNRETMKAASSLYGVTMDESHISKLLSVKLTEALVTAK